MGSEPIQAKTSKSGREYFRLGAESFLDVFAFGEVSSPRLNRLKKAKNHIFIAFLYAF